jgi:hypothetical protein
MEDSKSKNTDDNSTRRRRRGQAQPRAEINFAHACMPCYRLISSAGAEDPDFSHNSVLGPWSRAKKLKHISGTLVHLSCIRYNPKWWTCGSASRPEIFFALFPFLSSCCGCEECGGLPRGHRGKSIFKIQTCQVLLLDFYANC